MREYKTAPETRLDAKLRRDERRAAGICINGNLHGKATHGVLCAACRATHRDGYDRAVRIDEHY